MPIESLKTAAKSHKHLYIDFLFHQSITQNSDTFRENFRVFRLFRTNFIL